MADSISTWQHRLDSEGIVTFRPNRLHVLWMAGFSLLAVATAIGVCLFDGLSAWAVGCATFFGLASGVFGYQLATGRPNLTVTRTGLSFNKMQEVPYSEIREFYTSGVAFGISHPPRNGDELRGPWERRHGLKYSRIEARGVVDSLQVLQWIAHLMGFAPDELEGEPRFGRSVWVWRLPHRDGP